MKNWQKLALLGSFIGALNSGFNSENNAQAQTKKVRVVDCLLNKIDSLTSGIPNLYVAFNGKNYRTDSNGYFDVSTGVKDNNKIENKDLLNVNLQGSNLVFQYNGNARLKIYNLIGQEVFTSEQVNNANLNLSNLASGMYLYILDREGSVGTAGSDRGAFTSIKGNNGVNLYLKKNKDNEVNNKNINSNKLRKLEDITKSSGTNKTGSVGTLALTIKDELITSQDSVTNLGEYFDIETSHNNLDEVPNVINMIPVLQFDSPYYKNILNFIKYMTQTDGSTLDNILRKFNIPIKAYNNSVSAPNQNYIAAFDSAISQNENNSWESITSFDYKGKKLPKMNLFEEVTSNPDTGISMDYSTNFSHTIRDKWNTDFTRPLHAKVYIANNRTDWESVVRETKHELGHIIFTGPRHSADLNHIMQSAQYISKNEGEAVRLIYSLPNVKDMSIYKED